MKIAIRKDNNGIYIDKNLRSGIDYTSEPYNFILIDVDDKYADCEGVDFNDNLTFNVDKYNLRKLKVVIDQQIAELKQNLENTDYIDNKLTEAIVNYITTADNTQVVELIVKYTDKLRERQEWRDEIKRLEKEIKNGT